MAERRADPLQVDFYQLTGPPDAVLARIAERATDGGGRLLLVSADGLDRIDDALWRQPGATFLPHGRADAADADDQPILLSDRIEAIDGVRNVALADGQWRDEALSFDRAFHLFGPDAVDAARAAWRALKDARNVERRFWKQDEAGKWTQAG